ncbi:DNA-3-methyladenine glycosylase 2 family protein [Pseudoalteromonas xiamenensis]|uniref:DNA-3-methyladenine glycosylase 2 family protein n=1 Tax=Pseudoalteromonas xiamenensis TaxID=882626 RepID=A0A975HN04_9GAMM|nr:AlkA N-terminal domain-containing protein [Pseudoalteromonas xiamenensis]QTH73661.1 DNA-3-methyladenine glycosylase 2 family protein [Pseudoalteromonas xiamenensis]
MYTKTQFQSARQSRDPRFDGLFYVAVKSTGIYCRPICPAPMAKEQNVEYFEFAHQAAQAGFRPCIRCRPDSAPGSYAWQGTGTTANRAKKLIDEGVLNEGTTTELADRLGISVRHLNKLFQQYFATTPKSYALYKQCDFAKQLLQQSQLSITDIAYASGFSSVRRFNDAFSKLYQLTPSHLRAKGSQPITTSIRLFLTYRPPYNWGVLQRFLAARLIEGLEWISESSYGRTFEVQQFYGRFTATFSENKHGFMVDIEINDVKGLHVVVQNIRRVLDLDADCSVIEDLLKGKLSANFELVEGLRLPGIWSPFEAGIRAILGQQVSVKAARTYVQTLYDQLGVQRGDLKTFPNPERVATSELDFFKMPERRKASLKLLADYEWRTPARELEEWLAIKGIGPWTVQYAQMRGQSHPDIFLGGDLGVIKAMDKCEKFTQEDAAPFRSYLTFQLWSLL